MTLYEASVPVFARYLGQAGAMVAKASDAALATRIADALPGGAQVATAAGYALRIACPLAGRAVPDLADAPGKAGLLARIAEVQAHLAMLRPADFNAVRMIRHTAGFAVLEQDSATFLHHYGMPNFMFHLTMAYATLRAAGVVLGKADFDGLHSYPAEFRFP